MFLSSYHFFTFEIFNVFFCIYLYVLNVNNSDPTAIGLLEFISSNYAFFFLPFLLLFINSHMHTLFGSSLSLALSPFPPCFQAELVLPLSLILMKRRHQHNKEDKAFFKQLNSMFPLFKQSFLQLLPWLPPSICSEHGSNVTSSESSFNCPP
jgi:hypothetical protein